MNDNVSGCFNGLLKVHVTHGRKKRKDGELKRSAIQGCDDERGDTKPSFKNDSTKYKFQKCKSQRLQREGNATMKVRVRLNEKKPTMFKEGSMKAQGRSERYLG